MITQLLVDARERVWPAHREAVAACLGPKVVKSGLTEPAVARGLIFAEFRKTRARIALRPDLVANAALSELVGLIAARDPDGAALISTVRVAPRTVVLDRPGSTN